MPTIMQKNSASVWRNCSVFLFEYRTDHILPIESAEIMDRVSVPNRMLLCFSSFLVLFPAQIKGSAILRKAVLVNNMRPQRVLGFYSSSAGQKSLNPPRSWFFTAITRKAVSAKNPDVAPRSPRKTTDTTRTENRRAAMVKNP